MNASLTINRIVATAEIDRVILLLNSTTFVDDGFNVLRKDFTGNDVKTGQVNYTAELNEKALNAKFLFGRICVWTKGADQGIYSQVVKLK